MTAYVAYSHPEVAVIGALFLTVLGLYLIFFYE